MKYIKNLEPLRGLIAIWVLICHVTYMAGIPERPPGPLGLLLAGQFGVGILFTLSGFVIFYLLDNKRESYGQFLSRRFLRIYPVYLIALVFSAIIINLSIFVYKTLPWQEPNMVHTLPIALSTRDYFLPHLLAHLVLLQGIIYDPWLPYSAFAILGTAWTLTIEWQFYLLAPLVLRLVDQRKVWMNVALFLFVMLLYWVFRRYWFGDGLLFNELPSLALGVLSYFAWKDRKNIPWLLLCSFFMLVRGYWETLPWLGLLYCSYKDIGILENPVFKYLGKLSYSVYIIHMPVVMVMSYMLIRLSILEPGRFMLLLGLSTLGVTLVLSHFLYHYVELPFMNLGKQLWSGKPKKIIPTPASPLSANA